MIILFPLNPLPPLSTFKTAAQSLESYPRFLAVSSKNFPYLLLISAMVLFKPEKLERDICLVAAMELSELLPVLGLVMA